MEAEGQAWNKLGQSRDFYRTKKCLVHLTAYDIGYDATLHGSGRLYILDSRLKPICYTDAGAVARQDRVDLRFGCYRHISCKSFSADGSSMLSVGAPVANQWICLVI